MPPIYDYVCRDCKNEFDVFYTTHSAVKKEEKQEKCPKCGSVKKKRLVSKQTGHVLKGSGWYRDGYK